MNSESISLRSLLSLCFLIVRNPPSMRLELYNIVGLTRIASLLRSAIRTAIVLSLFLGGQTEVRAAEAGVTTYFLVPALGPLVAVQAATGGEHIGNRGRIESLGPPGVAFDAALMNAMESTLTKIRPDSVGHVIRARVAEGTLFLERTSDDDAESIRALKSALAAQLANAPSALAVVVAPFRSAPNLRSATSTHGEEKVAGLGFYIDRETRFRVVGEAAADYGYLGVFVNIRVLLVDLVAAQVVHDETATAGTIFARTNSPDGNPWNAATSQQKVSTLERMVADEVRQLMPTLFENKK